MLRKTVFFCATFCLLLLTLRSRTAVATQTEEPDDCLHLTDPRSVLPGGLAYQPDKTVMVYFHAPWCSHCKKLTPQYKITCMAFAAEPSVVTAMMNMEPSAPDTGAEDGADSASSSPLEDLKSLRTTLGITGYPTMLLFPETDPDADATNETPWVAYTGPRKHRDLLTFLNEHAGTFRQLNGTLGSDAGRIPQLDAIVSAAGTYDSTFLNVLETAIGGLEGVGLTTAARREAYGLYRSFAAKTVERGDQFPQQEVQRLSRLLAHPQTVEGSPKAEMFVKKLNVVSQFLGAEHALYGPGGTPGLVQALDRLISAAPALDDSLATALEANCPKGIDCKHYVLYAKKIAGNGLAYVDKELKRLAGLLASSSVLQHKKVNLQIRFNVLRQFQQLHKPHGDGDDSEERQEAAAAGGDEL